MIHEIQCVADHFADITGGRKSFIMQKETDAQYRVGDFLALNEYTSEPDDHGLDAVEITGRCCLVEVVHIYRGAECYLQPGTIVLSIRPCSIASYDSLLSNCNHDFYEVTIYGKREKERA